MSTATQEQEPETKTTELATQQEAPLSRTGAMGFGLAPATIDEAWRLAGILAKSALVPKGYLGKPEDVLVAMLYGNDLGLPPMAALQSVAVINGKPGVYGDGFLGVIQSKPAYAKHLEFYELRDGSKVKSLREEDYKDDETKAVSMFWRKGNPEPFVEEFSIGAAKRAKLWGKEGPWAQYPARQLMWRARGFAGRNGFAAELRGIKMVKELRDIPEDEPGSDNSSTYRTEPPPTPVRASEKATSSVDAGPELTNELPEAPSSQPAPATAKPATAKPAGASATARATATTRKPDSTPQPNSGTQVKTESMVLTDSQYIQPKGADPFWEIKAVVKKEGQAPVGMVFVTKDQGLYKLAESCEGSDQKFNVTWHGGKRQDGTACKVLDGIEAAS